MQWISNDENYKIYYSCISFDYCYKRKLNITLINNVLVPSFAIFDIFRNNFIQPIKNPNISMDALFTICIMSDSYLNQFIATDDTISVNQTLNIIFFSKFRIFPGQCYAQRICESFNTMVLFPK